VYDASTMAAMRQGLTVKRGRRHLLATVDYSLAKRALINQVRTGLASWTDICDAHPELMRAAEHVGEPTRRECPVCHDARLKLVTYVYGDGLKHDNGRVWPLDVGLDMAADTGTTCTRPSWHAPADPDPLRQSPRELHGVSAGRVGGNPHP
jgi:hypothetical protein